jgi:hypothetical protein
MRAKFILPWFGTWPWYFPLWAASLERNPGISAAIITNLDSPSSAVPKNLDIIQISMGEVLNRIQLVTNVEIPLCRPHKLCDYRPLYALAFPEITQGCEYWGYCDMDMIFGDLSPVIRHAESGRWDIISPNIHVVGHCTLIKNSFRNNSLVLRAPQLARRLVSPSTTFLDEGGMNECASIAGNVHILHASEEDCKLKLPRCFVGATIRHDGAVAGTEIVDPVIHFVDNKIIVHDNNSRPHEVLYLHFMGKKDRRYQGNVASATSSYSFTGLGFQSGLFPPNRRGSKIYRVRKSLFNADKRIYGLARGLVPRWIVDTFTQIRLKAARLISNKVI